MLAKKKADTLHGHLVQLQEVLCRGCRFQASIGSRWEIPLGHKTLGRQMGKTHTVHDAMFLNADVQGCLEQETSSAASKFKLFATGMCSNTNESRLLCNLRTQWLGELKAFPVFCAAFGGMNY